MGEIRRNKTGHTGKKNEAINTNDENYKGEPRKGGKGREGVGFGGYAIRKSGRIQGGERTPSSRG